MTQPVVYEASDGRIIIDDSFKDLAADQKRTYMVRFCDTARNTAKKYGDRWGALPSDVTDLWDNLDKGRNPRVQDLYDAVKAYNMYIKCKAYAKPVPVSDNPRLLDGHDDDNTAPAAPAAEPKASQPPAAATTPPASDSSSTPELPQDTPVVDGKLDQILKGVKAIQGEIEPIKSVMPKDKDDKLVPVAPLDRLVAVERKVDEMHDLWPKHRDGSLAPISVNWRQQTARVGRREFSWRPAVLGALGVFLLIFLIGWVTSGFWAAFIMPAFVLAAVTFFGIAAVMYFLSNPNDPAPAESGAERSE